jgi:prepilin-type N-terminal cleavage/methylation domain-containing protein
MIVKEIAMSPKYPSSARSSGFSLIELLIVVIILAILAAIVIPQFSSSTTDAKESALDANLASMRNAIELFKVQHANIYPGAVATSGGAGACTGGTKGTGAANSGQAFIDSMLMYSDYLGRTCTLSDATDYKFGPYLRKGVPNDPITGLGSLPANITVTSAGTPLAPGAATGGWAYDTKSGQIVMNSNANDSKGAAYSTH